MDLLFFIKTLCELSLFFAWLPVAALIVDMRVNPYITLAVCAGALLMSFFLRERKWLWRAVPLLLLGFFVFSVRTIADGVVLALVCTYAVYIVLKKRYMVRSYRQNIKTGLTILLPSVTFIPFTDGTGAVFLLIYLVGSVVLLRSIRHDAETIEDPVYKVLNIAAMLPVMVAGLLIGSQPVRSALFSAVDTMMSFLLRPFMPETGTIPEFPDTVPAPTPSAASSPLPSAFVPDYIMEDIRPLPDLGKYILGGALAVAVLFIMYFAVKKILSVYDNAGGGQFAYQRERIRNSVGNKRASSASGDNAVRRYYRKFLRLCASRGMKILPWHTSAEIEVRSADIFNGDRRELRDLYIRARYSNHAGTRADAVCARKALRRKF